MLKGSLRMPELEDSMVAGLIEREKADTGMDMVRDFRKIVSCFR